MGSRLAGREGKKRETVRKPTPGGQVGPGEKNSLCPPGGGGSPCHPVPPRGVRTCALLHSKSLLRALDPARRWALGRKNRHQPGSAIWKEILSSEMCLLRFFVTVYFKSHSVLADVRMSPQLSAPAVPGRLSHGAGPFVRTDRRGVLCQLPLGCTWLWLSVCPWPRGLRDALPFPGGVSRGHFCLGETLFLGYFTPSLKFCLFSVKIYLRDITLLFHKNPSVVVVSHIRSKTITQVAVCTVCIFNPPGVAGLQFPASPAACEQCLPGDLTLKAMLPFLEPRHFVTPSLRGALLWGKSLHMCEADIG